MDEPKYYVKGKRIRPKYFYPALAGIVMFAAGVQTPGITFTTMVSTMLGSIYTAWFGAKMFFDMETVEKPVYEYDENDGF